jgi:hypothetical protein
VYFYWGILKSQVIGIWKLKIKDTFILLIIPVHRDVTGLAVLERD